MLQGRFAFELTLGPKTRLTPCLGLELTSTTRLADLASSSKQAMSKKWLCVDTDAGCDDAVALCFALSQSVYEVKLITTSFGNSSLAQVNINVAKTRKACGRSSATGPRIVQGANGPLVGGVALEASYFHGQDGLGDVSEADSVELDLENDDALEDARVSAVDALLELCLQAQQEQAELLCVTLGPCTNLAAALASPDGGDVLITSSISKLVVMGGCANARGNVTRCGEFNVCADPEAAAAVFSESRWKSITVVPWELCVSHPLLWHEFDKILSSPISLVGNFIKHILQLAYVLRRQGEEEKRADSGAVVCDLLAIVVAIDESMVEDIERVHVEVELEGKLTRGMTVVDAGHCYDGVLRTRLVRWVTKINQDKYHQHWTNLIS